MKWKRHTSARIVLSLMIASLCASTAKATNYVVDGLNGNDGNVGISATGGPGDLVALDFSGAFKTIGQATSVTAPGDFIFVNAGLYSENVVSTEGTTLMAVGEVIVGNISGTVFRIDNVPNVTIDGFTIENSVTGVFVNGNSSTAQLKNLTIRYCTNAMNMNTAHVVIRRCIITDCLRGLLAGTTAPLVTLEQCTIVNNGTGVQRIAPSIRNNIIAFNSVGINFVSGAPTDVDFNNVFGNEQDYISPANPGFLGANNVSVDPQFVDLDRRILHLLPTSPLINAGEGLGGGPAMTIGAREIGLASSDALDGWAGWIDENGTLLTSGSSTLVEIDVGSGHITLKPGVTSAVARSPVFDLGPLKSVEFAALEDLAPASLDRRVIDQDASTFQRELRFRASATAFAATAATPAFEPFFEGQVLELLSTRRHVQVELTLRGDGL